MNSIHIAQKHTQKSNENNFHEIEYDLCREKKNVQRKENMR